MTNPDGMSDKELRQAGPGGGSDYAYLDQTRKPSIPLGGQGDGISSPELNPAYYPKSVKPEALHGEAEKDGAEFPTGGTPDAKQEKAAEATRTSPEDALKEQQKQDQAKQDQAKQERPAARHQG